MRSSSLPYFCQRPDSIHSSAGWMAGIEQLDGAGAVHLLADDRFQLLDGAQAERQIGVDAGGDFADHAGAHHQLLADDVGVGGNFANVLMK